MILLGVVFALYGLTSGPAETMKQLLLGDNAPDNQRVEAFAWAFSVLAATAAPALTGKVHA